MKGLRCTICGKPAIIERRQEGRNLCRRHFMESFEKKFRKAMNAGKMVEPDDSIAIAMSGGTCSSAMAFLLKGYLGGRNDARLEAIMVDEGVRGGIQSVKSAKSLCKKLEIKANILSFKNEFGSALKEKAKEGNDAATLRGVGLRWLINKKARELGFKKVSMGTCLDNEAETILMNYMRGDIARAARSSRDSGDTLHVPRFKPMRLMPKKEIELYAGLRGIQHHDSNPECSFRADAGSMLDSMESRYPGIKYNVVETFDKVAGSLPPGGRLGRCSKCGESSSRSICKKCELWG